MKADALILTDADFDAKTAAGVVLIDFWAPRCPPCRVQGPIIDKVAALMDGKAVVGKCDVDKQPKTAERFGIKKIPALVILKDKQEVARLMGLHQEAALITALNTHLE